MHVQLIRCLLEQGKRAEALEQTRKAQERFPESPELQTLRRDILNKAIQ